MMPACIALVATSVRAAPSLGSSTMASTLSLMNVSIWLIWRLASLVPSAALNSMSEYLAASSFADLLTAASQPWSAAGPEKPMVTFSPGASLSLAAPAGALEAEDSASGVLLVQPVASRPRTPAAASSRAGRDVVRVRNIVVVSLLGGAVQCGAVVRVTCGGGAGGGGGGPVRALVDAP